MYRGSCQKTTELFELRAIFQFCNLNTGFQITVFIIKLFQGLVVICQDNGTHSFQMISFGKFNELRPTINGNIGILIIQFNSSGRNNII